MRRSPQVIMWSPMGNCDVVVTQAHVSPSCQCELPTPTIHTAHGTTVCILFAAGHCATQFPSTRRYWSRSSNTALATNGAFNVRITVILQQLIRNSCTMYAAGQKCLPCHCFTGEMMADFCSWDSTGVMPPLTHDVVAVPVLRNTAVCRCLDAPHIMFQSIHVGALAADGSHLLPYTVPRSFMHLPEVPSFGCFEGDQTLRLESHTQPQCMTHSTSSKTQTVRD